MNRNCSCVYVFKCPAAARVRASRSQKINSPILIVLSGGRFLYVLVIKKTTQKRLSSRNSGTVLRWEPPPHLFSSRPTRASRPAVCTHARTHAHVILDACKKRGCFARMIFIARAGGRVEWMRVCVRFVVYLRCVF